ncbi:ABC transporter ATP-binding protein [Candidatus Parvarchaeota archaeon]|nr:ABC transporter ATP-binding protein [Candidatus Parvarchaeota archaeon]
MAFLNVEKINFTYPKSGLTVLNGISFSANELEFVSIIGPSGCGKSTLLRIMAGLIKADSGSIVLAGKKINSPSNNISFVFQDFALLPWLSNLENVKIGLASKQITEAEREKTALEMLYKLELKGFEDAYPNLLSGGMKQRVGLARALVSNPTLLLMDEPFSSLDELTANSLRKTVVEVLKDRKTLPKVIVMVSHNIEEAVEMSDRIVVLSNKPAVVKKILSIDIKRPRDRGSTEFRKKVKEIYSIFAE